MAPSSYRLLVADCRQAMSEMAVDSVDAMVCDPPYFLNFMNKGWDKANPKALDCDGLPGTRGHGRKPGENSAIARKNCRASQAWHETWAREALRVLKPGGFCVAFGGTRTSHRLVCALEDAGFEVRDTLCWLHSQGFPKGKDFAKDDAASRAAGHRVPRPEFVGTPFEDGWNVALKPAFEPIVLARRPLVGSVAANVARFGTGGLDVEACRIACEHKTAFPAGIVSSTERVFGGGRGLHGDAPRSDDPHREGRWPANVVLSHHPDCLRLGTRRVVSQAPTYRRDAADAAKDDGVIYGRIGPQPGGKQIGYADADGTEETARYACVPECPIRLLDAQAGPRTSGAGNTPGRRPDGQRENWRFPAGQSRPGTGPASRFFPTFAWAPGEVEEATRFRYVAKASTRERGCGLPDGMANTNPCVKPVALLRWVTRLVCPPNGTVLDPFAGSGSEGIACLLEGFDYIGVEMSEEYAEIARRRLAHVARHGERWLEVATAPKPSTGDGCYDVGKGWRTVARCPEHDAPQNERSSAYACGCPVRRVDPRSVPRHTVPSDGTPDYAGLPLFAALGAD